MAIHHLHIRPARSGDPMVADHMDLLLSISHWQAFHRRQRLRAEAAPQDIHRV